MDNVFPFIVSTLYSSNASDSEHINLASFGASGVGSGMDIVVSSVKAYISALNKMSGFKGMSPLKSGAERTAVSA